MYLKLQGVWRPQECTFPHYTLAVSNHMKIAGGSLMGTSGQNSEFHMPHKTGLVSAESQYQACLRGLLGDFNDNIGCLMF